MKTPYRPNVRGLTSRDFDHVGTPDLRKWTEYWEGVRAGARTLTQGSNDTVAMAAGEIAKLTSEISAREAEGMPVRMHTGNGRRESCRRAFSTRAVWATALC